MSEETRTRGRVDALRSALDAAAAGKWTGWRLVLLWVWILVGIGLILAYIAVGIAWLETAGVVVLSLPLAVRGLLALRGRK